MRADRGLAKSEFYKYVKDHKAIKYRPNMDLLAPFKIDGKYCRLIALTMGQFVIVDAEDYERINRWKWNAQYNTQMSCYYAKRTGMQMHRAVLGLSVAESQAIDHANHNTLDNRKVNLRPATTSQNCCNRKISIRNKSGFKGVHWDKSSLMWRASIRLHGKLLHLGRFAVAEDAADAYWEAAKRLHGEFANRG